MSRANKLYGLFALSLLTLCVAAPSWGEERNAISWYSSADTAWKTTQQSKRPMLLFFTMHGCSYCEQMKRVTYRDSAVIADIQESFVAASIDSSRYPTLTRRLGIQAYPTTVIIAADGRVLESISGYVEPQQLRRRLRLISSRTEKVAP